MNSGTDRHRSESGLGIVKSPPRQRSRAWFFTKDNATEETTAQFQYYFDNSCECEYVYQFERSESGMYHLQGVIRFKNPRANWPEIEAHWERCRNWRQAVKYCTKIDTRVDGPWTNIKGLKFRKTVKDVIEINGPNRHQEEMMKVIESEESDRVITWIYDQGKTGKTTLIKHYLLKSKRNIAVGGKTRDAIMLISQLLEQNIDPNIVFFSLTRSREQYVSYDAIEQIKDGMAVSTKYECNCLVFNSPKVVVMANYRPDESKLTEDRWKIYNMEEIMTHPYPPAPGGARAGAHECNTVTNESLQAKFERLMKEYDDM